MQSLCPNPPSIIKNMANIKKQIPEECQNSQYHKVDIETLQRIAVPNLHKNRSLQPFSYLLNFVFNLLMLLILSV